MNQSKWNEDDERLRALASEHWPQRCSKEGRPGGLGQIALATDGDYIYFTWMVDISDIWVADVVDED